MNLKVFLDPSDEGGFTAIVPSLPGCISEGDTREETLANIREAIALYLEKEPKPAACAHLADGADLRMGTLGHQDRFLEGPLSPRLLYSRN